MQIHEAIAKALEKNDLIALPNAEKFGSSNYYKVLQVYPLNLICVELYGVKLKEDMHSLSVKDLIRDDWMVLDKTNLLIANNGVATCYLRLNSVKDLGKAIKPFELEAWGEFHRITFEIEIGNKENSFPIPTTNSKSHGLNISDAIKKAIEQKRSIALPDLTGRSTSEYEIILDLSHDIPHYAEFYGTTCPNGNAITPLNMARIDWKVI